MNISGYLERIKYNGATEATLENLSELHRAHMLAVPFENLDIHLGNPIKLDIGRIYEKIVSKGRGGFCYELNGMFGALLKELGFEVEMLAAAVYSEEANLGHDFGHMLLRVNQDFIADVGFGDSFSRPMRLATGEQQQETGNFRLMKVGRKWRLERVIDEVWTPQYLFSETPQEFADFSEMCEFQQTSPESIFTRKIVCSKLARNGRDTYANGRLIKTRAGELETIEINSTPELEKLLKDPFGITLDGGYDSLLGKLQTS